MTNINSKKIEELEVTTRLFFSEMVKSSSQELIYESLNNVIAKASNFDSCKHFNKIKTDDKKIMIVIKKIGEILNIKVNILVNKLTTEEETIRNEKTGKSKIQKITKWKQNIENKSIADLFAEISKIHCHTIVDGNTKYKCSFHYESLFTHSILTMLNIIYLNCYDDNKINKLLDFNDVLYVALTGLLHDIGKVECYQLQRESKYISFANHAEIGAGIVEFDKLEENINLMVSSLSKNLSYIFSFILQQ